MSKKNMKIDTKEESLHAQETQEQIKEVQTEEGFTQKELEENRETGFSIGLPKFPSEEDCLTFGRMDTKSIVCQSCKDARLCAFFGLQTATAKTVKKTVKTATDSERDVFGLKKDSVQSLACYQFASDQLNGINRPMKKTSLGITPYTNCPWNRSNTTVYDYRKLLIRHKDSDGQEHPLAIENPTFTILFAEFSESDRIQMLEDIRTLKEDGKIL